MIALMLFGALANGAFVYFNIYRAVVLSDYSILWFMVLNLIATIVCFLRLISGEKWRG